MRLLILILSFFFFNILNGQNEENIIVKIRIPYSDFISLDDAREIIKKKCFEEALEQSNSYINVERNTQTVTIIANDTIKNDRYFFNFNTNHNARVIDYKVVREGLIKEADKMFFETEMSVVVKSFNTKIDNSFTFSINTNGTFFKEGDFLKFKFKPNKDGYLNVIIVEKNVASKMFPNLLEEKNFFNEKVEYGFPLSQFVDYKLEANENEICEFYFIFTRKDIFFSHLMDTNVFLKKLYSLELNERSVEIIPITILKK